METTAIANGASEDGSRQIYEFPGKAKSEVWVHFGFYMIEEDHTLDKSRAICRYCKYGVRYTGNTTNLHTHYNKHHCKRGKIKRSIDNNGGDMRLESDSVGDFIRMPTPIGCAVFSKVSPVLRHLVDFIIDAMIPFSSVYSQSFQNFMLVLNPKSDLPDRKYLEDIVVSQLYEEERSMVVSKLVGQESVSLAADVWTSSETYMTVYVHFISRTWIFNSYALETVQLSKETTPEEISDALQRVTTNWSIICEPTLVSGHVSVLKTSDRLGWKNLACFSLTLNKAALTGLDLPRIQKFLVKCRETLLHFRSGAGCVYDNCSITANDLLLDNCIRWNSTYDMLERLKSIYPQIRKALDRNIPNDVNFDEEDFLMCKRLVKLLGPLNNASMMLCEQKNLVASMILPVLKKLEVTLFSIDVETSPIEQCRDVIWKEIKAPYASEEIREFLLVCSLLDPRYKELRYVEAVDREKARRSLYDAALSPFVPSIQIKKEVDSDDDDTYIQSIILGPAFSIPKEAQPQEPSQGESKPKKLKSSGNSPSPSTQDWLSDVVGHCGEIEGSTMSPLETVSSEIDRYMGEKQTASNYPLSWWYEREKMFPNLSCLAKTRMCVMATSVHPGDIFEEDRETVRARRANIETRHIDAMIFLNKNHKALKIYM